MRTVLLTGLVAALLSACSSLPDGGTRRVPLVPKFTAGPLPQPQPFVADSRRSGYRESYPTIGYTPPRRRNPPMTEDDVRRLDDSLKRAGGVRSDRS